MGTVYYGLAGEGHGHGARASTVIEHLRLRHRVVVLTFGKALAMLRPQYAGTDVEVREIPGMHLEYGAFDRMSPTKTILRGARVQFTLERRARQLADELRAGASLVISDFEPLSMRAAQIAKVQSLSIDHQRFLQACAFDDLPLDARAKIAAMAWVIDRVYGKPQHMIVSGFYLPSLRSNYRRAQTAGALIRNEILEAQASDGDHLLTYVRRNCPRSVLRVLERSPRPVRLYGLGQRPSAGAITYRDVSKEGFIQDLASCKAVITTAGNQLIGEAFHLSKPVLAFPEPGNLEQHINAHLLHKSGGGLASSHRAMDERLLDGFLQELPHYRQRLLQIGGSGNAKVFRIVDDMLTSESTVPAAGSRKHPIVFPRASTYWAES